MILVAEILVFNPYLSISKPTIVLNNMPITQKQGDDMDIHFRAYLINVTIWMQVRNKLLIIPSLWYIKQPYSISKKNFNDVP